jgi:hypothetical protein
MKIGFQSGLELWMQSWPARWPTGSRPRALRGGCTPPIVPLVNPGAPHDLHATPPVPWPCLFRLFSWEQRRQEPCQCCRELHHRSTPSPSCHCPNPHAHSTTATSSSSSTPLLSQSTSGEAALGVSIAIHHDRAHRSPLTSLSHTSLISLVSPRSLYRA